MVRNVTRAIPGAYNSTKFVQLGIQTRAESRPAAPPYRPDQPQSTIDHRQSPINKGSTDQGIEGSSKTDGYQSPIARSRDVLPPDYAHIVRTTPLPMSMDEARRRGWDEFDIVFVTGDAYIDHPSFAMAILGRVLEACGYRVGIIAQPDWRTCEPWKVFGRPRLFFAISAGNMDSMINHYTANRKVRNDDAYSPGGRIGLRPDRATLAYCQRAREAYKGVPIVAGGVEASLRRLAHYDYWSDTVRRSILLDAKADLIAFGMGESAILEIARRLDSGEKVEDLRDMRGVAYALGAAESQQLGATERRSDEATEGKPDPSRARKEAAHASPTADFPSHASVFPSQDSAFPSRDCDFPNRSREGVDADAAGHSARSEESPARLLSDSRSPSSLRRSVASSLSDSVLLPSFEQVKSDKLAFAEATRRIHLETNPYNARTLIQWHDRQAVVCNPPRLPESPQAMDFFYDLPYTRRPHPIYKEPIPAFQVVKDSVTIMRGCFGGCTYCSITTHQGRIIQSRSKESIVREVAAMGERKDFKGTISDLGGPTANMYEMRCVKPEIEAICRRLSCVHPKICPLLGTDHGNLIDVMRESRNQKGVKKVLIASGVRMDLAQLSPEYMHELTAHHVGGHLKVAPEHTDNPTLAAMKRPSVSNFKKFAEEFQEESKKAGKEQYLVPYFISAHPGSDLKAMIDLAIFLKENGYKPEQVQDFIPAPFDISACMFHTGLDPITMKPVYVAKNLGDRKMQRALMQFFKPENYFAVRKALVAAGRADLIGEGCHALIPAHPPAAAIEARRQQASRDAARGQQDGSARQEGSVPRQGPVPREGSVPRQVWSSPSPLTQSKTRRGEGGSQEGSLSPDEDHVHSRKRMPGQGYRPGRRTARKRDSR